MTETSRQRIFREEAAQTTLRRNSSVPDPIALVPEATTTRPDPIATIPDQTTTVPEDSTSVSDPVATAPDLTESLGPPTKKAKLSDDPLDVPLIDSDVPHHGTYFPIDESQIINIVPTSDPAQLDVINIVPDSAEAGVINIVPEMELPASNSASEPHTVYLDDKISSVTSVTEYEQNKSVGDSSLVAPDTALDINSAAISPPGVRGSRGNTKESPSSLEDLDDVPGSILLQELVRRGALHCCDCGVMMLEQELYQLHTDRHTHDDTRRCTGCHETFPDVYKLQAHLLASHVGL